MGKGLAKRLDFGTVGVLWPQPCVWHFWELHLPGSPLNSRLASRHPRSTRPGGYICVVRASHRLFQTHCPSVTKLHLQKIKSFSKAVQVLALVKRWGRQITNTYITCWWMVNTIEKHSRGRGRNGDGRSVRGSRCDRRWTQRVSERGTLCKDSQHNM